MTATDVSGPVAPRDPTDADRDAAARAALYALLARAFDHPDEAVHAALVDGALETEVATYLDRSALEIPVPSLTTVEDYESVAARYNGLFAIGYAEYADRTDGSLETEGPPVPLYECRYRDASWADVNADLARAFDHFGVSVDETRRDHHDNVRLELEFAAYLARREALGEAGAARARRDLLARHLEPFTDGILDRMEALEGVEAGVYADLARFARDVVTADLEALRASLDVANGNEGESDG